MHKDKLDATIIIPTYNGRETLRKTLEGIFNQNFPGSDYEVIVIDDGSTDGTEELFSEWRLALEAQRSGLLRYVRLPENRGRASARNAGIREARAEIIIFLDNDNLPCEHLVREHVKTHAIHRNIVAVGNRSFPEGALKSRFIRFWNQRYVGNRRGVRHQDLPFYFAETGNGSVNREDLIQAGGFDESFSNYGGEDEELWYRLCVVRGLKNVFLKEAKTVHIDPDFSYRRSLERMRTYGRFSAPIISSKHPQYFDTDIFIKNLEPINLRKDGLRDMLRKAFFTLATSPPGITWIEWATKKLEFNLRVPFPQAFYGLVLCRYYRLGVRERRGLAE